MAVRTHVPWWGRGALVVILLAIIGGMWWWGFDFGQILGGFNRKEIEAHILTEAEALRAEATNFARATRCSKASSVRRGAWVRVTQTELLSENAQLKGRLAFCKKVVRFEPDRRPVDLRTLSPDGEGMWRYRFLLVRGGSPKEEFKGNVVVQATVSSGTDAGAQPQTILLPEDEPTTAPALVLKFKYYQRVEGRFRVPPGGRVTAIAVRCFEAGQGNPRATRTLSLS
jgi:hypothetical protein